MTTVEKLNYLISIKSEIKVAIENKGVDMTGVSFLGYASKIGDISSSVGYTNRDVIEVRYQYNISNSASFVYSSVFIGKQVETVNLPNCLSVGRLAFASCSLLSQVNLPICSYIDVGAFIHCDLLSQVSLPMCSHIDSTAFYSCSSLSQVSLPMCEHIGYWAFYGCSSLSQISLPVCSYISLGVFQGCYSLSQVSLPICSYIGSGVFTNCLSLSRITIGYSDVCSLGSNVFLNTKITSSTGSIYVPASLVNAYKSATNWSAYSNRIFAI